MARASVVIVGAGISGLSAAWELSGASSGPDDSTPRIEVIERAERVGGALATAQFGDRTIDLGADGFLARRPEAVQLIRELGLEGELEAIDASGAWIFLRGRLDELPGGLVLGVPTSVSDLKKVKGLSSSARRHLRRDAWFPKRLHLDDDASIGDIVRTKFGREVSYQFIEPMIGGIQAGRIDELSARSVFPALFDAAKRGGSLMKALRGARSLTADTAPTPADQSPMFYTLRGGVGSLPGSLAQQLRARGVIVRTGVGVSALRRTPSGSYPWAVDTAETTTPANVVILATPASETGRLLGEYDGALRALEDVPLASAAMVTFRVDQDNITVPPRGTGVLVPLGTSWSGEGTMMVTAVTLLDRKWPHLREPHTVLLRAHVGRSDDERALALSDEQLIERVSDELRVVLGRFEPHGAALVQRWPSSLPQYRVGHQRLVENARASAHLLGATLVGMTYDGVGIPASIGSGRRGAREARAMLDQVTR
jgi:oxygen-dependent protoporphyrinogen oxidase